MGIRNTLTIQGKLYKNALGVVVASVLFNQQAWAQSHPDHQSHYDNNSPLCETNKGEPSKSELVAKKKISQLVEDAKNKGLTGYVYVSSCGDVLLSQAAGAQNEAKQIANSMTTVFDIGSNTKQFTAAAILKLAEQKKLSLEQPLSAFFSDVPSDKADITIHQLLTHSAGFQESMGRDFQPLSKAEFIQKAFALSMKPKDVYRYSNIGYSFLAAIIEKVTGDSYESYLVSEFFKPLGMAQTGYLLPMWKDDNIAIGYHRGYRDIGTIVQRYQDGGVSWHLVGNGGLQSTTQDMVVWLNALQSGEVLSQSSINSMLTQHVKHETSDWQYGYGWGVRFSDDKQKIVSHNGSNGVYWSSLYWLPESEHFIIVSSNGEMNNITPLASRIKNILINPNNDVKPIKREIYWELAQYLQRTSDVSWQKLAQFLTQNDLHIDNGYILNRLGFWALDNISAEWAISLLEQNLLLFPSNGEWHDSLGEARFMLKQYNKAANSFEKALLLAENENCNWCKNSREKLEEIKAMQ